MKRVLSTVAAVCALGVALTAFSGKQAGIKKVTLPGGASIDASELKVPDGYRSPMPPAMQEATGNFCQQAPARAAEATGKYGKYFDYNVADDEINYFTFKLAGFGGMYRRGIMHATSDAPSQRTMLSEWPHLEDRSWDAGEHIITAATMVDDEMWAYVCESWTGGMTYAPVGIYKINFESGREETQILAENPDKYSYNNHASELSYDPSSGYLYALRNQASGWLGLELDLERKVERLDVNNPSAGWEELGTIDYTYTMAADDGYIYFIQPNFVQTTDEEGNQVQDVANCSLRKICVDNYGSFEQSDLEDVGLVNHGFLNFNYLQTMEFDHSDHTLWWHGANYDNSGTAFMTRLDIKTAETDDPLLTLDQISTSVGLCIPYECVDRQAPHYVRSLSVTIGSEGAATASFSWKNPTKTSDRNKLGELTQVRIYRDGELVKTMTDVKQGETSTWTDSGMTSGMHVYKFVTVNSKGEGLSRERHVFVGHDVPKAPSAVTVATEGTRATISWTAPVIGVNGGWIDQSTLKYDVKRLPDNKTIATAISETSCTDEVSRFMGYSYVVTASTADGKGDSATSIVVPFGPAVDVPYTNELMSVNDANMLTIIDANGDGYGFDYDITPAEQGKSALWIPSTAGQADDWIILPELNLKADKQYRMYMTYMLSNYTGKHERFEMRQGNKNTVEAQTNLLGSWEIETKYADEYELLSVVVPDPSKGNYLSIRLNSDPDQGWVVISKIEVREYSTKDASLLEFDGPAVAFTGGKNIYTVKVRNESRSNMRGAKAQLISYPQGELLAEASVPATKPGETQDVEVEWQPSKAGTMNVTARVELSGDTYEEDNITDRYITVEVQEGAPSVWTNVLKKDNTGWAPFYTSLGYSQVETIYTREEIGLEDVTFTGICYEYEPADGYENALTQIPVEIYLATTDRNSLSNANSETDGTGDMMPENIYTECFKGIVNMAGRQQKNNITMMFTQPFYYSGSSNLVVRNVNANEASTKNNNYWYIAFEYNKPQNELRSNRYNPGTSKGCMLNDHVPVIKLAYKNGHQTSSVGMEADGFVTLGAGAFVNDRRACFAEMQDVIEVFDANGAKVATLHNTDKSSQLTPGVYVVTGRKGTEIKANKLFVK